MSDLKTIFCSKFAIRTFPCYRCKCWHLNSKVSLYIIWYVFGPHTGEIWTKSYGPKCTKLRGFGQNPKFFKTILDKELTPFCTMFFLLQPYLLINYYYLDYYLSPFQKLRYSDTYNQVKSCTKHGRPTSMKNQISSLKQNTSWS